MGIRLKMVDEIMYSKDSYGKANSDFPFPG